MKKTIKTIIFSFLSVWIVAFSSANYWYEDVVNDLSEKINSMLSTKTEEERKDFLLHTYPKVLDIYQENEMVHGILLNVHQNIYYQPNQKIYLWNEEELLISVTPSNLNGYPIMRKLDSTYCFEEPCDDHFATSLFFDSTKESGQHNWYIKMREKGSRNMYDGDTDRTYNAFYYWCDVSQKISGTDLELCITVWPRSSNFWIKEDIVLERKDKIFEIRLSFFPESDMFGLCFECWVPSGVEELSHLMKYFDETDQDIQRIDRLLHQEEIGQIPTWNNTEYHPYRDEYFDLLLKKHIEVFEKYWDQVEWYDNFKQTVESFTIE